MLHLPVHDVTSGYRVWSRRALELMSSNALTAQGYCFLVELTLLSVRCGLNVVEVPITFANREAGASKLSLSIALETAKRVTMWGLDGAGCYSVQS
jgi:dolichol-phosphate mannosyltransferase